MTLRGHRHVAALAAALASCAPAPRTELVVVVDSDLARPDPLSRVSITVVAGDVELGPFVDVVDPARVDARALPISLGVTDRTVGDGTVTIVAAASNRDGEVVSQRATLGFVPGEARALCLRLDAACVGVACADGTTCADGACVPALVDASTLPAIEADDLDGFACPRSSHATEVRP